MLLHGLTSNTCLDGLPENIVHDLDVSWDDRLKSYNLCRWEMIRRQLIDRSEWSARQVKLMVIYDVLRVDDIRMRFQGLDLHSLAEECKIIWFYEDSIKDLVRSLVSGRLKRQRVKMSGQHGYCLSAVGPSLYDIMSTPLLIFDLDHMILYDFVKS